jgi:uncharacterized protein GlcG (DUF336 family)
MRHAIIAAAVWMVAASAWAQAPKAKTLDQVVAHGAAAERAQEHNAMLGSIAEQISHECEKYAAEHNISVSIFIVDQYGQIVHSHRMDGQIANNIETALMKAKTVLWDHQSSHVRMNQHIQNPFTEFRSIEMDLFPNKGGLPIVVDKQFLGAIGVGGSGLDEECADYALTQVLGPQPPLVPNIPARPPLMGDPPQRGRGAGAPAPTPAPGR